MKEDLKELYYEIKTYIEKVNFEILWKDFKPLKFALYNNDECFFDGQYVHKTEQFIANTAINYQGEIIAIWNVLEEIDPIVLASKMIHEMFHGFQMMNNESRFPDELDALYKYKYDDNNLSIKLEENKLLLKLLDVFDMDTFKKLLEFRKYRYDNYSYEYNYESKIEQIEGCANYIELNVLKQLSNELYQKKLDSIKKQILSKENYFPIRVISYDIGALLLLVLKDNKITFNDGFDSETFSISLIKNVTNNISIEKKCFKEDIDNYYDNANSIIDKAIKGNDVIENEECNIVAVNVYNAIYYNNYIISTYFVMYEKDGNKKIEYGNFVIKSEKYKKLSKIYRY